MPSEPHRTRTIQHEIDAVRRAHPNLRFVDAILFDLCGMPLGKRYPITDLEKLYADGMALCAAVCLLDATGNTSDPMGHGVSDGDPDAVAWPLSGTLAPVPWAPAPTAQVLTEFRRPDTGLPVDFEPRTVLKRVTDRFETLGLTPVAAVELEFYLIDRKRDPHGGPLPVASPRTGRREEAKTVYGMETLDDYAEVLGAITDACAAQNIPASAASTEFAPGQFEINLRHQTDPVRAADHACLLRRCVKAVARAKGFDATFLSKPFPDHSGSGLHVHLSFEDRDGHNVLDDAHDPDETRMRAVMAGLQAAMPESMAFFAPNLNAFRRFQPDQFVPVTRDWGYDNRSVAFRIPSGRGRAKRIEHRVAGADANPYLALACVLAGAHYGLSRQLEPLTGPGNGNVGVQADPALPRKIWQALEALRGAPILNDYLGPDYVEMYRTVKADEFEALMSAPLPREYDWYL